ncbi:MAG TPA: hypothetical protein PKO19_00160 [Chitinophagales bacterium]|nr:hypothetical protein [Chitinophagales bacterium]HNM28522.1 hypothetical protein [Chitinophagales bacterium]
MGILTYEKGIYKEPMSVFGKTMILVVFILFTTRILTRTPLVDYYMPFEILWYTFIITFTFIYAMYIFLVRKTVDEIHYYYILIIIMPLWAGFMANLSEGQNVMGGISSQRHWYGISGIFVLIYLLQTKFFTIGDLFRAMKWLGWGTMAYFIWCYIFLDPKQYLDYSFVGFSDIKGGYRFKFGIDFIAFLSVYYTVKYIKQKDSVSMWLSAANLAYLFFLHQGRSVMISVVATLFVFYMFEVNWQRAFRIFTSIGVGFFVIMGILYAAIPDRINDYVIQYTSLATVVFTGNASGESSVDARLEEMAILFVYLQSYPIGWWIGIGKLSAESAVAGEHTIATVPPGDIGILGSIMTYGILGSVLIYLQFLIAFRSVKFIRRYKDEPFMIASKYFLIFCFLSSLAKGYLFMQPGSTAIFILVIYAYKLLEVQMDRQGLPETAVLKNSF